MRKRFMFWAYDVACGLRWQAERLEHWLWKRTWGPLPDRETAERWLDNARREAEKEVRDA